MRLSDYTDYTLRVLMYCAAHRDRLVTIGEIAETHRLSKNHLMKIVNDLSHLGLLETSRGRGGGLRLLKAPTSIRVGDVVRAAETDFRLVECFDASTDTCTLTPHCRLKGVLARALRVYFAELDRVTLADIAGTAAGSKQTVIRLIRTGKPTATANTRRKRAQPGPSAKRAT